MRKTWLAFFGLFTLSVGVYAQKKSGAIQFETTIDPVAMASANGAQLSEEMRARMPKSIKNNFELLFTATQASYMPVEETEDSNSQGQGFGGGSGGMGRMMRFGGSGGAREYYYTFADQKLVEVFEINDTAYVMTGKLTVAPGQQMNFPMGPRPGGNNQSATQPASGGVQFLPGPPVMEVTKTEETRKILGFNCQKAIVKSIRKAKVLDMETDVVDETAVWYTTELGFNFSPNPNLWVEGAVLALENKANTTIAKSIEYRGVSTRDVTVPKKAISITAEQYKEKMESMMRRFGSGGRQGGGNNRNVVFN